MKYSVVTFGCRVNQADSLGFEEDFLAQGRRTASDGGRRCRRREYLLGDRQRRSGARVRRSGASTASTPTRRSWSPAATRPGVPTRSRDLPNVVRVVPNDDKPQLVPLLGRAWSRCRIARPPNASAMATAVAVRRSNPVSPAARPLRCACRPAARSRARTASSRARAVRREASRSARCWREVRRVIAAGFKEIALTGVHLGSYGTRSGSPASLVADSISLRGARRQRRSSCFRISSLEPMDCTPDDRRSRGGLALLRAALSSAAAACQQAVLLRRCAGRTPSNSTRRWSTASATAIPHASIGSDIIVGFPGETDDDFESLASYLESSPLTHLARISLLGSARHSGRRDDGIGRRPLSCAIGRVGSGKYRSASRSSSAGRR